MSKTTETLEYLLDNIGIFQLVYENKQLRTDHIALLNDKLPKLVTTELKELYCARCLLHINKPENVYGGSYDGICCTAHRICETCWFTVPHDEIIHWGARMFETEKIRETGWMDINKKYRPAVIEPRGPTCTYYCGWNKQKRKEQTTQIQNLARIILSRIANVIDLTDCVDDTYVPYTRTFNVLIPFNAMTPEFKDSMQKIKNLMKGDNIDEQYEQLQDDLEDEIQISILSFETNIAPIFENKIPFDIRITPQNDKSISQDSHLKCSVKITFNGLSTHLLKTEQLETKILTELSLKLADILKSTSEEKSLGKWYTNVKTKMIKTIVGNFPRTSPRNNQKGPKETKETKEEPKEEPKEESTKTIKMRL